jgi:hypothetical protein
MVLMIHQEFNEALLDAVDFALDSLGKSSKQALYFHLKECNVERADIPDKINEFDSFLKLIFKDGASFLERLILRKLCDELKIAYEDVHDSGFVETVSRIRRMASDRETLLTGFQPVEDLALAKAEEGR